MALGVKHLNADTTFLLTFSPAAASDHALGSAQASFTILTDPWLCGHSSIWNTKFQVSQHTTAPCITSLRDLALPDLILISQDKPDHCHRETLCTLPPDSPVNILATPAAAKKIRAWQHFQCANIQELQPYSERREGTVARIPLKPKTPTCAVGQVTIAYMPDRMDVTRVHNAVAITYHPPQPPAFATEQHGDPLLLPLTPPDTPCQSPAQTSESNASSYLSGQVASTSSTVTHPIRDQALSVLYTPHGVGYSVIAPYLKHHLAKTCPSPLTALFHSINVEQNPWFMGGLVTTGYPGGHEIVRKTGAKYWIGAHDEVKDNKGWATVMIKSQQFDLEYVQTMLDADARTGMTRKTTVMNLDVGHEVVLR